MIIEWLAISQNRNRLLKVMVFYILSISIFFLFEAVFSLEKKLGQFATAVCHAINLNVSDLCIRNLVSITLLVVPSVLLFSIFTYVYFGRNKESEFSEQKYFFSKKSKYYSALSFSFLLFSMLLYSLLSGTDFNIAIFIVSIYIAFNLLGKNINYIMMLYLLIALVLNPFYTNDYNFYKNIICLAICIYNIYILYRNEKDAKIDFASVERSDDRARDLDQ